LIVILVFQFAYLVLLSGEVRFARRLDRFEPLVERPRWESVWPFFLIIVLLSSVATTDLLDRTLGTPGSDISILLQLELFRLLDNRFEILKTLVFQGTFLLGLTATTLIAAFPFGELIAALRSLSYVADEASTTSRAQYLLRSIAVFRVARGVWLYGGAMIGTLTAMQILSEVTERPMLEKVVHILGPSLIGFVGYTMLRRAQRRLLSQAPPLRRLVAERTEQARLEKGRVILAELERVPWRWPVAQLAVPIACLAIYLVWTGSGVQREAIRGLVPVTSKDWLVILPYAVLVPLLIARDPLQRWLLRRASLPADAQPGDD
jgi:hypothetical protein